MCQERRRGKRGGKQAGIEIGKNQAMVCALPSRIELYGLVGLDYMPDTSVCVYVPMLGMESRVHSSSDSFPSQIFRVLPPPTIQSPAARQNHGKHTGNIREDRSGTLSSTTYLMVITDAGLLPPSLATCK